MRKRILTMAMAAACLLSACNNEEEYVSPEIGMPANLTFSALPTSSDSEISKTYTDGTSIYFNSGDKISVFDSKKDNNEFTTTDKGARADFSGKATKSDKYYALYPYQSDATFDGSSITATLPSSQSVVTSTFDPKSQISVATVENNSFKLMNVTSVFKFTTTEAFSKIVIKGNNGEKLSGKIKISNFSSPTYTVVEGQQEITLSSSTGNIAAGTYYVPVLPSTLSKGFTLQLYKGDDLYEKSTTKSVQLQRASSLNLQTLTGYKKVEDDVIWTLDNAKTPEQVFKAMGLGWNLGNQLDAWYSPLGDWLVNENYDGPKATQELFNALAKAGIKTVRIPVTWFNRSTFATWQSQNVWTTYKNWKNEDEYGPTDFKSNFTGGLILREEWLNRVYEVVQYAKNAGLNAIINIHHDGADSNYWLSIKDAANSDTYNGYVKKQIAYYWGKIAEKFKNDGKYLIFESFNEIHDGGWGWGNNRYDGGKQYSILNDWNQLFVNTVRNVGGENADRWLSVPGYCTNPDITVESLKVPTDSKNKIMVAVHYYGIPNFTLGPERSGTYVWGEGSNYKDMNETDIRNVFSKLQNKFINNNVPVYIGEIGCVAIDNAQYQKYRVYFLEYASRAMYNTWIAPILWDNGASDYGNEKHGYFNHNTGAWINEQYSKPVIEHMIKALESTESGYNLDYIYKYMNPNQSTYRGY